MRIELREAERESRNRRSAAGLTPKMTTKEESLSSEALDVVVRLLFELEEERGLDDFYDRICEAVCLQTSMERAVLFLYDAERKMVLPAGSHGVYREFIVHGYGTLEETPIAQRALAEDRVVETTDLEGDVPARYANLPGISSSPAPRLRPPAAGWA